MESHGHNHDVASEPSWFKRHRWVTYVGLAILAYFLFVEHREHVFQFLPYLILLACPLMHIFMHGGHKYEHGNSVGKREGQEQ